MADLEVENRQILCRYNSIITGPAAAKAARLPEERAAGHHPPLAHTIPPQPQVSKWQRNFAEHNREILLPPLHRFHLWLDTWQFGAKKIDVLSRSIFPISFITFNLTYWSYYLSQIPDEDK